MAENQKLQTLYLDPNPHRNSQRRYVFNCEFCKYQTGLVPTNNTSGERQLWVVLRCDPKRARHQLWAPVLLLLLAPTRAWEMLSNWLALCLGRKTCRTMQSWLLDLGSSRSWLWVEKTLKKLEKVEKLELLLHFSSSFLSVSPCLSYAASGSLLIASALGLFEKIGGI